MVKKFIVRVNLHCHFHLGPSPQLRKQRRHYGWKGLVVVALNALNQADIEVAARRQHRSAGFDNGSSAASSCNDLRCRS
jgi:hypothetical protein